MNSVIAPPVAWFNIVNEIGAMGAADSWALHRLGGAYYNGYLFLSTPRNAADRRGYFLDLEVNPVATDELGNVTLVPQGQTWGLRPEGQYDGRILSRVEAANHAAPFVIWVQTPMLDWVQPSVLGTRGGSAAVFRYTVPKFGLNTPFTNFGPIGPVAPVNADIHELRFDGQPDALLDFTTASANGKVKLFWTKPNKPSIFWSEFDGTTATAATPVVQLDASPTEQIVSIDAAAVQVGTGETQSLQIALIALMITSDNRNASFRGWLIDPVTGKTTSTLTLPPLPPLPDPWSTTVRAGWGAPPSATGQTVQNGLVLACVASQGAAEFNGDAATGNINIIGLGPLWVSVIDLSSNSAPFGWRDTRPGPPKTIWNRHVAAASGPLSVLFPIPIPHDNQTTYYVGLAAAAMAIELVPTPRLAFLPSLQFYINLFKGFEFLLQTEDEPQDSGYSPNFNEADIIAALGSWTLIGMIAGLPPYFPEQSPGSVSLQYALATTGEVQSSLSTSKVVTVGSTLGLVSASAENAAVASTGSTQRQAIEATLQWSNDTSLPADHGIAIYWQPAYQRSTFVIQNSVGKNTGLTMSMIWAGGAGGLKDIPFSLTNFRMPAESDPVTKAFTAGFPANPDGTSVVAFPRSDDPKLWTGALSARWMTKQLPPIPVGIPIRKAVAGELLDFGSTKATSMENKVTISLQFEASAFGEILGVKAGGEFSFTSSVTTTFGQSQKFTINYGSIPPAAPFASFELKPLLLQPSGDHAPWLPGYNAAQRPWLLVWRVESLIPK